MPMGNSKDGKVKPAENKLLMMPVRNPVYFSSTREAKFNIRESAKTMRFFFFNTRFRCRVCSFGTAAYGFLSRPDSHSEKI